MQAWKPSYDSFRRTKREDEKLEGGSGQHMLVVRGGVKTF